MTEDLATWLLEQIAEDERLANDSLPEPWLSLILPPDDGGVGKPLKPSDAHIVRWEPNRVLAECETKRRIVQLHSVRSGTGGTWDTDPPAICNEDNDVHPCGTLCLVAAPYADRPGYREEWKP